MNKFFHWLVPLAILASMGAGRVDAGAGDAVALSLKVSGDVHHKKGGKDPALALKVGCKLDDNDNVRTGSKAFATLVFTDDKSLLKLTELTEITIAGKRDAQGAITKQISMEIGNLYAKIEQQRGTLQIATPTSVASVKGTAFWIVVLADGTTHIVTIEGLVELRSKLSGQIVEVRPGQVGESLPDGSVGSREAQPGDTPEDPEPDQGKLQNINIQLQDREGRTKDVEIQVKTP